MSLLKQIAGEFVGMFLGDVRLTVAVLILIAVTAALVDLARSGRIFGGVVLLGGALLILIGSVRHGAKGR